MCSYGNCYAAASLDEWLANSPDKTDPTTRQPIGKEDAGAFALANAEGITEAMAAEMNAENARQRNERLINYSKRLAMMYACVNESEREIILDEITAAVRQRQMFAR